VAVVVDELVVSSDGLSEAARRLPTSKTVVTADNPKDHKPLGPLSKVVMLELSNPPVALKVDQAGSKRFRDSDLGISGRYLLSAAAISGVFRQLGGMLTGMFAEER